MEVKIESEIKSKKTFKCEYCGKQCSVDLKFKVYVAYDDLSEECSLQSCSDCVAMFFTETPEKIAFASISRVKAEE